MIKANKEELKVVNDRYNDVKDDIYIGLDYVNEGLEIVSFEVDEKGRTTMEVEENYLNSQFALRTRYYTRHPRLNASEICYLLGKTNSY